MRKICALLYYVHPTTYNGINCNRPRVLIRFHTQRSFHASLSIRVSDSDHPITYDRKFCTNNTGHKIHRWMSVHSTQHHTLLHNPTILHTKKFCASLSPAQDIPLCDSRLHNKSYASKWSYNSTYKDIFRASLSPALEISPTSKYA